MAIHRSRIAAFCDEEQTGSRFCVGVIAIFKIFQSALAPRLPKRTVRGLLPFAVATLILCWLISRL